MKNTLFGIVAMLSLHSPCAAQDTATGHEIFGQYCAACHGIEARGDGPMAPNLVQKPPNLRTLSTLNDGIFPIARVVMRIDGRDPLVAHGSMMPVYGHLFDGDDTPMKSETGQPIMTNRTTVDLVQYLEAIQD
jgi:mono/diheme cytochrome c family protein